MRKIYVTIVSLLVIVVSCKIQETKFINNRSYIEYDYTVSEEPILLDIDINLPYDEIAYAIGVKAKDKGIVNVPIFVAQTILETGYYKSDLFKNGNNLVGMKHPKVRKTTSLGKYDKSGHAFYESIEKCIDDYKKWQNAREIKKELTHEEYCDLLIQKKYAEDKRYKTKLLKIIKNNKDLIERIESI